MASSLTVEVPASENVCRGLKERLAQLGQLQRDIALIVSTTVECAGEDRHAVLRTVGDKTLTVEVIEEE